MNWLKRVWAWPLAFPRTGWTLFVLTAIALVLVALAPRPRVGTLVPAVPTVVIQQAAAAEARAQVLEVQAVEIGRAADAVKASPAPKVQTKGKSRAQLARDLSAVGL